MSTERPPIPIHDFFRLVAAAESRNCSDPIGAALALAKKIAVLYTPTAADIADPLVITGLPKPCEVNLMGERGEWRHCLGYTATNAGAEGRLFRSFCSAGHVVFERWVGKSGVWAEEWPADAEERMKAKADEECKDPVCAKAREERRALAQRRDSAIRAFVRELENRYSRWVDTAIVRDALIQADPPTREEIALLFGDPLLDTDNRQGILDAQAKWPGLCQIIERHRAKADEPAATALASDEDLLEFEPDDPEADSQDIPA